MLRDTISGAGADDRRAGGHDTHGASHRNLVIGDNRIGDRGIAGVFQHILVHKRIADRGKRGHRAGLQALYDALRQGQRRGQRMGVVCRTGHAIDRDCGRGGVVDLSAVNIGLRHTIVHSAAHSRTGCHGA